MSKFLLSGLGFCVAFGLEISSFVAITSGNLLAWHEANLVLLHFSASLLSALVLPISLPQSYKTFWLIKCLFIFIVVFFMPVLGIVGLVSAVFPGLRKTSKTQGLPMHVNKIRTFSETPANQALELESEAVNIENLMLSKDPDKRLNAVYATLKFEDKTAIPLLRKALRDPVDDIRLLAYALIDRKEQRISERIESTRRKLEDESQIADRRYLYRSIVKDYWEIAHLGLAEGETLNYVLNNARCYLEKGLAYYPKDQGLHLQYAKLLLRQNEPQAAYKEFKLAESHGIGREKLLLYYAEIAFLLHQFSEVKQYMKEINLVKAQPQIQGAIRFWQKEVSVDV